MQEPIGRILKSYEIEGLIGTGGFGAVYRARQSVVEREVAIKIIWPAFASHPNFIRRFESEAQLVAGLEHPHIVPLYDYWRDPDGAYIVMRWIRGGHLRTRIGQANWSLVDINRFVGQMSAALALAHRFGVVHRDIKPENILLDDENNAYLADFGIAQILSNSRTDDDLAGFGSPAYSAPEQIAGGVVSSRSDLYSLGILIFEMLTGRHPFPDLADMTMTELVDFRARSPLPSVRSLRPELPASLDAVLQRATALDPAARYPDVSEFAQAFQEASSSGRIISLMPAMAEAALVPNPYKGLRAFQETDAHNFFGREGLVHRFVNRLKETSPFHRFLAVIGPSGSGKSSVVKAGLIPALKQGALPGSADWFYDEFVPGPTPFNELESMLVGLAIQPPVDLLNRLQSDPHGLAEAIDEILPGEDSELFLFIDQFEEVFTLVDDEAVTTRFLESLYTAVTSPDSRLRLVLTLRADFYDRPLLQPVLSDLVRERTEVVVPLTPIELERVVVEPARRVGVAFDGGLVALIVSEVRQQPGALPLLQYALSELFDAREGANISPASYRALGGVRGALARRAEEIYASFDTDQQEAARQLFLRLITLGEGTEDTRRRALIAEVTSLRRTENERTAVRDVVDQLGRSRLLTFDRDPITRGPTVEVAHEAIIREWQRLRHWLDDSRNDVRLQRMLAVLAGEWVTSDYDPSFLLRGGRLDQFERWSETTTLMLAEVEQRFLRDSIAAREQFAETERVRQMREQQLERSAVQRLRLLALVLLVAMMGALSLSGFAFGESNRAETALATSDASARISRSLALEASARRALSDGDGDLALALALLANDDPGAQPIQSRSTLAEVAFSTGTHRLITGHTAGIRSVATSPDGTLMASGSFDATVRVWSFETNDIAHVLTGHRGDVEAVAFGPDGSVLASGASDFVVILWDAATGAELARLMGHTRPVQDIVFSPDGRWLATSSNDGLILVWDAATRAEVRRLERHTASVLSLAFSPDSQQLLSGSRDGLILLWDTLTGQIVRELRGHSGGVTSIGFASDGQRAVSSGADGLVFVWDVMTGDVIRDFTGGTTELNAFAFNASETIIYTAGAGGQIGILDLSTGLRLGQLVGHTNTVQSLTTTADGRFLVSGSDDQTVRVWNIGLPGAERILAGHRTRVTAVGALDDARIVSASADGTLRIWDIVSGTTQQELSWDEQPLLSLDVAPGGTSILAGLRDGPIVHVDVSSGETLGQLAGHTGGALAIEYVDAIRAISGGQDGVLILWDLILGEEIRRFEGHEGTVFDLTLIPGTNYVASASRDSYVIVWNVDTGEIVHRLAGHTSSVYGLAASPDGRLLASAARDGSLLLWDVASAVELTRFASGTASIWGLDFSDDGTRLISGASDGGVIVWDVATGTEYERYDTDGRSVFTVDFMPGGDLGLSGQEDGLVVLWRTYPINRLIDWAHENRYVRELTCLERERYQVSSCP